MQIFIEAVDVWLFRDGRPFDALSDHRAESRFPPSPTVLQGVIRSHHLTVKGVDLRDQRAIEKTVGTATDYRNFRMRGPFLAKRGANGTISRCFPVPADAAPDGDGWRALKPQPATGLPHVLTSAPTPMLLWPTGAPQKDTGKERGEWLDEASLRRYLQGEAVKARPSSEFYTTEPRIGIGLNGNTRTTEEGALYEVAFTRPEKDAGLVVEVSGYDGWPGAGVLRIGGEGRGAYFAKVDLPAWRSAPNPLPARFKVYFASPTYFSRGWQPASWSRFFEGEVTLQAVALRGYESIGGYDYAAKRHKPAYRYVPAGSVYYFSAAGPARIRPNLVQQAITDSGAEIGFGQVFIEEW